MSETYYLALTLHRDIKLKVMGQSVSVPISEGAPDLVGVVYCFNEYTDALEHVDGDASRVATIGKA